MPTKTEPSIPVDQCLKLVDAAEKVCPVAATSTSIEAANYDEISVSLASQASALTFGSLVLGAAALAGGIGWGILVKYWAEKTARIEAQNCAKEAAERWLAENAPAMVAKQLAAIDNTIVDGAEEEAIDKMGEGAG